jgi:uncharacterized membrane protein YhaH (DUF805 family)
MTLLYTADRTEYWYTVQCTATITTVLVLYSLGVKFAKKGADGICCCVIGLGLSIVLLVVHLMWASGRMGEWASRHAV